MRWRLKAVKLYRLLRAAGDSEAEAAQWVASRWHRGKSTIRRWEKKDREGGKRGLLPPWQDPAPSRPQTPLAVVELIVYLRRMLGWGGARIAAELKRRDIYHISHQGVYDLFRRDHLPTRTYHPTGKRDGIRYRRYRVRRPHQLWHLDWLGPIQTSSGEKVYFLVIIDDYSRYLVDLRVCRHADAETAISVLREAFQQHSTPEQIMTDNARCFVSGWEEAHHPFEEFLEQEGIQRVPIPSYYPQANGKAEAFIRTFKREALDAFLIQGQGEIDQLQQMADTFRGWYNTGRIHSALGWRTPQEELLEHAPLPLPLPKPAPLSLFSWQA